MHRIVHTWLAAVALSVTALSAHAADDTTTPRIDKRQARQEARIASGVASGKLNAREANRMEKQQDVIENAEAKAKADGTVTAGERRRLTKMQNHSSNRIAKQKHDRQRASSPQ